MINAVISKTPIDVTDSIAIKAPRELVYQVVSNYPGVSAWFPPYACEWLGGASAVSPGVEVHHTYGKPIKMSDFVRRIDKVIPNERLEETYDRGTLLGKGVWTFVEKNGVTTASYLCQVDASGWFMKIILRLMGNSAHSNTYQNLLKGLKVHCEKLAVQSKA